MLVDAALLAAGAAVNGWGLQAEARADGRADADRGNPGLTLRLEAQNQSTSRVATAVPTRKVATMRSAKS